MEMYKRVSPSHSCEVAIVLSTKSLFQMSVEDLREGLDDFNSGCGHVYHDSSEHLGHLIYCDPPVH